MKFKVIVGAFLIAALGISCNDSKKEEQAEKPLKEVKLNVFEVELDVVSTNENMFVLHFLDGSNQWFNDEQAIWQGVKGNTEAQKVVLSLPDGVKPQDLRLDFCFEKVCGPVQINSVTLKYHDSMFKIVSKDFLEYFTPNEFIQFNAESMTATPVEVAGKKDPFFLSKPKLKMAVDKLLHGV